jgi:polyisoprenoid-binding protein YceI
MAGEASDGQSRRKQEGEGMLRTILATVLLFGNITAQRADTAKPYPIDTNHSTIGFTVSIMGGLSKVNGKFTDFTVNLTHDEKDITRHQ